jgi:glycosyltransferase involved in cell wall biosynthesis
MKEIRVAVVATHPIQYQIPWYQAIARHAGIDLIVYYALVPNSAQQGIGFGVPFEWDIPMFDGYRWSALENRRAKPELGRFFGSSTPQIRERLAEDRPDAVIVTGWNSLPLLQALRACEKLGIPRIVRGESNAMRKRPLPTRLAHRLLLSRFDAFLAIGKANRDFYLANGVKPQSIFWSRYFVDNERFARAAREVCSRRSELRQRWGIPEQATCFLFAGKLQQKKRIMDLLNAMLAVQARNAAAHVLIVGTGQQMAEAQSLVRQNAIRASFAGFLNQTQMAEAYAASDCLVLPSDHGETWGLVVNEAMACGLPAIVSDRVGCGPDLVEDGVTGMIFPFGVVGALAETMHRLSANTTQLRQMGGRAKDRIEKYSAESAAAGTVEAVTSVVGQ